MPKPFMTKFEKELLAALKSTTSALEAWVEIQDEEDARDSDDIAIKRANRIIKRVEKYSNG